MLPRSRRPPREILKSLDNKENQPDHQFKFITTRYPQFRIAKLNQVLTECNSTSASRVRTPNRGRQTQQLKDKSESQKNYITKRNGEDKENTTENPEHKRYLSTKESVQQYQTLVPEKQYAQPVETKKTRVRNYFSLTQSNDHLFKIIPSTCESIQYSIGPMIGKGSYALVKLGTNTLNQRKVALKLYDKTHLKGERLSNLIKEVSTLRQLSHDQIVKLYDVYHQANNVILVLEFCGTESLYSLLKQQLNRQISKEFAFNIIGQLLKILHYMHDRHIAHRDIKLENILIQQNKKIKLIDLGFSTFSNQNITCHCGTPSYMAPEVIQKLKYDARSTDIWALGVLFVCLIQGSFPFKGQNERELFKKIRNNEYSLVTNDKDIRYFLSQIFILDPTQRATAKELLQLDTFRTLQ